MPYRWFGRTNQTFGRPLWEILMNLKNFGQGRLVIRSANTHECPNIPSFYKIVSVHPHILEYPDDFRGNVFVEETFQGRKRAEIIDIGKEAGKPDFQLVDKCGEHDLHQKVTEFLKNPENHTPVVRPKSAPLPPVWKEVIARERGISLEEVREIPVIYEDIDPEIRRPTRIAEDEETPHFRIGPHHFRPTHPEFYPHVIWNREAAKEKYHSKPDPDFIYANRVLPPLNLKKSSVKSASVSQ